MSDMAAEVPAARGDPRNASPSVRPCVTAAAFRQAPRVHLDSHP